MKGWVVCAATPTSGIRHRFAMLSAVKAFAEKHNYAVSLLWGVTRGVAFCRFEELFSPVSGVLVHNVTEADILQISRAAEVSKRIKVGNLTLQVFRPGKRPAGNLFSWNLIASRALGELSSSRWSSVVAQPSRSITAQAQAYARRYGLPSRLGIRIRVIEEITAKTRRPRRIKRELDQTVQSIIRIPWYVKVFVATDSEYVQQMLASHFSDCVFLPKNFDVCEPTGRYVSRPDKAAMVTFLKEVECLCRCQRVINIGGFLNDGSIRQKLMREPYRDAALMHLRAPGRSSQRS
jgi:hypothetical protein